jgi:hypothetical protein
MALEIAGVGKEQYGDLLTSLNPSIVTNYPEEGR